MLYISIIYIYLIKIQKSNSNLNINLFNIKLINFILNIVKSKIIKE